MLFIDYLSCAMHILGSGTLFSNLLVKIGKLKLKLITLNTNIS